MGCGRSPRVAHVYRVVAEVPSACMMYRSSCRRWVIRTFGGCQLIHLWGVGEVAGDSDLCSICFAGGGVGDDVVGRSFLFGGLFRHV